MKKVQKAEKTLKQATFELVGHRAVFSMFERIFAAGRLAHAYLITGPKEIGKVPFALKLAGLVLGDQTPLTIHPDFILIERDFDSKTGKPRAIIALEQIHTLCEKLSRHPLLNGWQVAVIKDAQFMNREAANALLKTLEEPRDRTLILLTAPHNDSVLPTIRSRATEIRLGRVSKKEIEQTLIAQNTTATQASLLARMADGCPQRALRYAVYPEDLAKLNTLRETIINMIGADYAARWRSIEQLLPKKHSFQEAGFLAHEFLDVAAELLRDALLLRYEQTDRVAHIDIADGLRRLANSNIDLVDAVTELQLARQRINENVGPRNALQKFVLVF